MSAGEVHLRGDDAGRSHEASLGDEKLSLGKMALSLVKRKSRMVWSSSGKAYRFRGSSSSSSSSSESESSEMAGLDSFVLQQKGYNIFY